MDLRAQYHIMSQPARHLPALFVLLPHFPLVFVALSMSIFSNCACTVCEGVQSLVNQKRVKTFLLYDAVTGL
jgi:hypothetical protein